MSRVLLADDEAYVAALVRGSVDWAALGLEVVGEAATGEETYEKILSLGADIVITDIRMPGLSGLELMERVRLERLRVEFIVLSGYNRFDYAQAAVRYDAVSYVTKPLDEQELERALRSAVARIQSSQAVQAASEQASSQLRELRASFLRRLLEEGSGDGAYTTLEQVNQRFGCRFRDGSFAVCITHCDQPPGAALLDRLAEAAEGLLSGFAYDCQHLTEERRLVLVINGPFVPPERYVELARDLLLRQIALCRPVGIRLTMGLGAVENSWLLLHRAYGTARQALRRRILQGPGRLYPWRGAEALAQNPHIRLPLQRELHLTAQLETFAADQVAETLEELVSQLLQITDDAGALFALLEQLVDVYRQTIQRMGVAAQVGLESREQYLEKLERCDSLPELRRTLRALLAEPLAAYRRNQAGQEGGISAQMKAYVAQHYRENLRLLDIADQLYRNPSYIGTVFKKETGVGFNEYLAAYRIQMAKGQLLEAGQTIAGVADAVGFCDVRHFSKTFKRLVGMTPAAYRKRSAR